MRDLFQIQPPSCRQPLPVKKLPSPVFTHNKAVIERVILFNPEKQYEKIRHIVNPYARHQLYRDTKELFHSHHMFPDEQNGLCGCGCSQPLTGRRTRWASNTCSRFVDYVYYVIYGRGVEIKRCLANYYGGIFCHQCGDADHQGVETSMGWRTGYEIDHIYPVHLGGGSCWLSNYQFLCITCHKEKSKQDYQLQPFKPIGKPIELKMF
jgi:5-methylcytosine-specific restriction endonuclease McrA